MSRSRNTFARLRDLPGLRHAAAALLCGIAILFAVAMPAALALSVIIASLRTPIGGHALMCIEIAASCAAIGLAVVLANALDRVEHARFAWGKVIVGPEGVAWDGWVGSRFLPWKCVRAVSRAGGSVVIETTDGGRVELLADGLASALQASLMEYRRPDRSAGIGALGDSARGYRDLAAPAGPLVQRVEDVDLPSRERVEAAAELLVTVTANERLRSYRAEVRDSTLDTTLATELGALLARCPPSGP